MTLISEIATEHTTLQDSDVFELDRAGTSAKVSRLNMGIGILRSWGHIRIGGSTSRNKNYADHVCDGTADETDIANAIDDLPTGGGMIELLDGEFSFSTPLAVDIDNVVIRGQGHGIRQSSAIEATSVGTRIQAAGGFAGSYIVLVQKAANDRTLHGIEIRDVAVDGNSVAGPIGGIHFRAHRSRLINVFVEECTGNGILITGYSGWTTYDTMLFGCHSQFNDLDGYNFSSFAADLHVVHCISALNGQDGVSISSGGNQLTGLHSYGNTRNGVRIVGPTSLLKIVGSKIENSRQHGVYFETSGGGVSDVNIAACDLRCNGRGGSSNQYDQIHLDNNVGNGISRTIINGNQFLADGMDNTADKYKPGYNIEIDGTQTQDAVISNNQYAPTHVQTGHINDAGSRTIINGWGTNVGNPTSTGNWNGQGRTGIMVRDTSGDINYIYIEGGFQVI